MEFAMDSKLDKHGNPSKDENSSSNIAIYAYKGEFSGI